MTTQEIRELRKRLGMTQAQFAAALRVSVTIVSLWETGRVSPGPLAQDALQSLQKRAERRAKQ